MNVHHFYLSLLLSQYIALYAYTSKTYCCSVHWESW